MLEGEDRGLETERRSRLDSGLNSRGSPIALEAGELEAVNDFRFTETGALVHRTYASVKQQASWVDTATLPAPILTALGAGTGSLAAGDYVIAYFLQRAAASIVSLAGVSITATVTVGANDSIRIEIPPNNLGETVGQITSGADDPLNGGVMGAYVVAYKTTDPNTLTIQTLSTAFAWNSSSLRQRGVLSAYVINSEIPANAGNFPMRHVVWHSGIQRLIGWMVDRAFLASTDFTTLTRFPTTSAGGAAIDKNALVHLWSRSPTRLRTLLVDSFMLAWDGIGRPKSLHWTGSVATSQWRLIGANPPAAAPTAADQAAGVLSAGDYRWVCTYSYRHTRGNSTRTASLTTADCESNMGPPQVTALTLGATRQARVTLNAGSTESGLSAINIYRTVANGTTYYFVASVAAGTATYDDNTPDATIQVLDQPPDAPSKPAGNDLPPNNLDLIVLHSGSLYGVVMDLVLDASSRVINTLGTNRVKMSKFLRRNAADVEQREQIDAWPFEFQIGEADPITDAVEHDGRIYYFKATSVWIVVGNNIDNIDPERLFVGVGAMRDSVRVQGDLIYFWDQAVGACVMDGSTYTPLGYNVQPSWNTDRAAGYYPVNVFHDPRNQELHWELATLSLTPPAAIDNTLLFKEYVLYLPTKRWTQFSSATSGLLAFGRSIISSTQAVLSTDIGRQVYSLIHGDMRGRIVQDDVSAGDAEAPSGGIASATFKMFFGEEWEVVKQWISIFLYYDLISPGSSSELIVKVALLTSQASFQTLESVTSGIYGNNVVNDIVKRFKWKPDLVTRPGIGGNMNKDRGLLVKIESELSGQKIKGISLKYKSDNDIQDGV